MNIEEINAALIVHDDSDREAGSNCAMTAVGLLAAFAAVVFGALYVLGHLIAAVVS